MRVRETLVVPFNSANMSDVAETCYYLNEYSVRYLGNPPREWLSQDIFSHVRYSLKLPIFEPVGMSPCASSSKACLYGRPRVTNH